MALTNPGLNESAQDAVAILDGETFQPLFAGLNPMRVTVRETSKVTSFAVEDGTQRSDHRYFDPVEIDLPLLLTDEIRDTFEKLRQAYIDGRTVIVQTKVRSYPEMMIMEMPHDEDMSESAPIAFRLKEIKTVKPEYGTLPPSQVASQKQSSTVKKGNQQTTESDAPTQRKASVLYEILN
jgi:hypothetical protein